MAPKPVFFRPTHCTFRYDSCYMGRSIVVVEKKRGKRRADLSYKSSGK